MGEIDMDMSSKIKNCCKYNDDIYDGNINNDCIHHNTDLNDEYNECECGPKWF